MPSPPITAVALTVALVSPKHNNVVGVAAILADIGTGCVNVMFSVIVHPALSVISMV